MTTYMELEIPEELCQHLFLSFMRKPSHPSLGKDVKDVVAAMASQTAIGAVGLQHPTEAHEKHEKHHGLAEKLHGLSEKLHSLGHIRHDSSGGEAGKRSRAGTHAMHTCLILLNIGAALHACIRCGAVR